MPSLRISSITFTSRNARVQQCSNSYASKRDSGQYECVLIDRRTGITHKSAYTELLVMEQPRITLRPPTQTVRPGQSPTVECIVEGDEIQEISWKPVQRPLSRRVQTRGSTLIFRQIEVEDAGRYECFTKNRVANASAVAQVIVSDETDLAAVESHDNEQVAKEGAVVRFSCNVPPQSRLAVRWTKNGQPLPRSVLQLADGSLFIRLAKKSDSGHYLCTIRDQYGRQTSNYINLHIEDVECLNRSSVVLTDLIALTRNSFAMDPRIAWIIATKTIELADI
ncbi:contactin-5-like [Choristoneura fumiferana]|uniref:contactin-5-like n=1 Tax=Choristoneura fumiferana TaxID=7141 RepID=UPI003D15D59B